MKFTEADSDLYVIMFLFDNFRLFHVLVEVIVEKQNHF